MKKIVILGSGISGLTAGFYLQKHLGKKCSLTFIEKASRVGGWIETIREGDFLFEKGPRGFRPKGKGKYTLNLIEELGLKNELVMANRRAKKRYLFLNNRLQHVTPLLLLRYASPLALFKEWKIPPHSHSDESIASFFTRHFPSSFLQHIIEPVVQGIFGGKASSLSMQTCFPDLVEIEKKHGSLLKGFFKREKEKTISSLCTLKNGMETLSETLFKTLSADFHFSTEVFSIHDNVVTTSKGIFEADIIVSSLPPSIPFLTLTTIFLGFYGKYLFKKGFGYLIPLKEEVGILGMTWDSEIFPEQNQGIVTRLCVMVRGEIPQEHLIEQVLEALKTQMGITRHPDFFDIHVAKEAIPQYPVHFSPLKNSPPLFYIGSPACAVGVNDCIAKSFFTAEEIRNKFPLFPHTH